MGRSLSIGEVLVLLVKEGRQRILALATIFAVVAMIGLGMALLRPKTFESSALILVEQKSVIAPGIGSREGPDVGLMKQIVMSRQILREILEFSGLNKGLDARAEERMLQKLKARIRIESKRPELVRITYTDNSPKRTYEIAKKITDIYIRESTAPQEKEAREAFAFIDKQVQEYAGKLAEAHEQVLAYYKTVEASRPKPPPPDPGDPTPPPSRTSSISAAELAALRAEEATLLSELERRKNPTTSPEAAQGEARYRERAAQLQAELDRLLATFTDAHPDVKRARAELAKVKEAAEQAKREREAADQAAAALDKELEGAARARLAEVQRKIAVATGEKPRSPTATPGPVRPTAPSSQTDPDLRSLPRDATMSELLRRYEATRDIYQDLLKRRENARVSVELAEQRGVNLKIQEEPEIPVTAVSVRLLYAVAGGLFMAGAIPLGLLFALVWFDPRVRSSKQLQLAAQVPLLVTIPYVPETRERSRRRLHVVLAAGIVVATFAVYAALLFMRYTSPS